MFIYIIGNNTNKQKIGFSNNVNKRLKTLQTGNPEQLYIHHYELVPDDRARLLEHKLHKELNHMRIKGEWFEMSPNDAKLMLQFMMIRWLDDLTL
jgi:hypothetical protein